LLGFDNRLLGSGIGYRHGDDGAELERMDYLELIARVTSHIPISLPPRSRAVGPRVLDSRPRPG